MKTALTFISWIALVAGTSLRGEDLATLDGQQFKNIKIAGEKPDSIKVMHDGGISVISKTELPADFLALHRISGGGAAASAADAAASSALLDKFIASTPTFKSSDGREFKSTQIKAVEPSGLRVFTDSGPVRLKFTDLSEEVQKAFHYNAEQAAAFEKQKAAKSLSAAEISQRMANAASVVDKRPPHARLALLQNVGTGWLCHMQFLHEVAKEVTTSHKGSILDAPTVPGSMRGSIVYGRIGGRPAKAEAPTIYETKRVDETEVASDEGEVMVFGLPNYSHLKPDLQGTWQWSGNIYWMGLFEKDQPQVDGTSTKVVVQAYHLDRSKAMRFVAENGLQKKYRPDGQPDNDLRARIQESIEANDYVQAMDLINEAKIVNRQDPPELVDFRGKVMAFVEEKSSTLARGGEKWDEAAAYVEKFLEGQYRSVLGDLREPIQTVLTQIKNQADKRLYDRFVKSKTPENIDQYLLQGPVKAMQSEVLGYRHWLQDREVPKRLAYRLLKIDWGNGQTKSFMGKTVVKLFVDDVGDEHNNDKEDYSRSGITSDGGGLRVVRLRDVAQDKKVKITLQTFNVGLLGDWQLLSKVSKEVSAEELGQKALIKDDVGNKYTFEVEGVDHEPFMPAVWRVSL